MSVVASLLVRFPGKRMVTPRDFNARITCLGPRTYELDLETIIRGREHDRKPQSAKSSWRARIQGCPTEVQQHGEIDQCEAGLGVPLDDICHDDGDIC